jgi:hypothetical protein
MLTEDGVPAASTSAAGPSGTSNGEDGEYGVDPNLDPELAMVRNYSLYRRVLMLT